MAPSVRSWNSGARIWDRLYLRTFVLILFPAAASAQEGAILFDRAVQYDFEVPEAWAEYDDLIPLAKISSMLLLFDESASLMIPAPIEEEEEELTGMERRAQGMAQRLKMGSPSRSDQESLLEAYVSYEDDTIAETREFMGRTFLISGTQPSYAWKLTGEQSEFLGFTVHRATAAQDSTTIEAWFTPEIPVPAGPGLFGGLPGMILSVSVDDGHTVYSATEVHLDGLEDGAIKPPEDGRKVSRDEYEQIVAEKLAELEGIAAQEQRQASLEEAHCLVFRHGGVPRAP
jgi:GLPGLI family protein